MATWHSGFVEYFRRTLPSDSFIRPYSKRMIEDARSLLRWSRDWTCRERRAPETLFIETTNICNANCVFCAYQYQHRFRDGKGIMSDALFDKALSDYVAFTRRDERSINFTPLVGEPLVDPQIVSRVACAKSIGAKVTFFSNGLLLDRIDVDALLATGVDHIVISTAPFDRESHETVLRTHGKYGDLLDGLRKLLDSRNAADGPTHVTVMFRAQIPLRQIIKSPDFRRYILPRLRKAEVSSLYAQVRAFDTWGGQIRPSDLPAGMGLARPPRLKRLPCRWTFSLMVTYEGLVRACSCRFTGAERVCSDGLLVGDLRAQTLEEIWKGEALMALHRRFERGALDHVCRSCTMYRSV